jgi:Domain of unknown function (DUF4279)
VGSSLTAAEDIVEACAAFVLPADVYAHGEQVRRAGLMPRCVQGGEGCVVGSAGAVESLSLGDHLTYVLDRLDPDAPWLQGSAGRFLCYLEPRGDNAELWLGAEVLVRIAALHGSLGVDIRWYESGEEAVVAGATATERLLAGPSHEIEAVEAYASFRLAGDDLDPAELTRVTRIEPDVAVRKGEPTGLLQRRARTGVWTFTTQNALVSRSVEPHLVHLLDRVEGIGRAVDELRGRMRLRADLFCMWSAGGPSGGPWISGPTLARVAALNAGLVIDAYSLSDPDEADAGSR